MIKINSQRRCCKDVFHAFLVKNANYAGLFEFPILDPSTEKPNKLISFSKALKSTDYDSWVHFYQDDYLFESLWDKPEKYLECLKRFNGVILPDFSLYRDMPLVMQLWNIYRSRAIGRWLQDNGVKIIPNIRFGDYRTFELTCNGIPTGGTIAVGSHGTLKNTIDRKIFSDGLNVIIKIIHPSVVVVYGAAPASIFKDFEDNGIVILQFDSDFAISHKKGTE